MSSETNLQLFPGVFRSTVGGENPGFFLHSDGRVGIGNKAPTTIPTWDTDPNSTEKNKLNVSGHTHIEGNLNVTASVYGDGSNMTGVALPWAQSTPNLATDIKYEGGNVGIGGVASGTEALTVYGDLNLKSGGQLKFNGQTPVFSNWSVDGSDIYRSTGNVGIGGAASGTNKLKVHGTVEALSFSGIQATDVPTLNQDTTGNAGYADSCGNADTVENLDSSSFFRGDTTNEVDVRFAAEHGRGVRFWDSDSYKIYMSSATDGTWGGRLDDSDYNMYFRMTSGTKRGFVFLNNRSVKCHINGNGDLYLNGGWLRTYGSRGWYSQTYGGGWFMQDTTYVRVHSNKVIYTGGSILAGGNVTAYSDIRRKKDLLKIDNALDKVEQLTGYTYTNKLDNKRYTGLIAQDVQKVLPEAVNTEELDGHLSLAYGNMMGLLVEAVKELTRKNEILEARLNVIENNR